MGTRLERYRRRQIEKRIKIRNRIIVLVVFIIFLTGLFTVDITFRELLCLNNIKLLDYRHVNGIHDLQLFGKKYLVKDEVIYERFCQIANDISSNIKEFKSQLENILIR